MLCQQMFSFLSNLPINFISDYFYLFMEKVSNMSQQTK